MPSLLGMLLISGLAAWAQSFDLPAAPGKGIVENTCGACHAINRLGAVYTPEGWHSVVQMMQNMEVPVPPEQWTVVADYLIKSFPEKTEAGRRYCSWSSAGFDHRVAGADCGVTTA